MWNRFGSPTPRAGSGTEEEFERAVASFKTTGKPDIKFYFNQQPFSPQTVEASEQKTKVLAFRNKIRENGLTSDYAGSGDFERHFRDDIESWLVKHSPSKLILPVAESVPATPSKTKTTPTTKVDAVEDSGMWFLLGNGFYTADEIHEPSSGKITLSAPVSSAEDDATFRAFQPDAFGRHDLVPFAHQNTGALARVIEAQRSSREGTRAWQLTLQLEKPNAGFHSEMSINGMSPDQIAELRAQRILLNKEAEPKSQSPFESALTRMFTSGMNTAVKVDGSVLPDLWKNLNKEPELFLPLARLWSVFQLITSETCEHILELRIGPVKGETVHVKFRGRRRRRYSNVEPYVISVEGDCDLSS
jgi:hypothetical protein